MSWSYEILADRGLCRVTVAGSDTKEEFLERIQTVYEDPAWSPGLDILLDLSRLDSLPLSTRDVKELARLHSSYADRIGDGRLAVVAPARLVFGLARMWQAHAEHRSEREIRVFRERDAAVRWLHGSSRPEMERPA